MHDMDRRQFIGVALMSSAMLLAPGRAFASLFEAPGAAAYAPLRPLPAGAVRPEGWLRGYLQKQAEELGSNLPKVSWPFTEPYWKGAEQGESWWPWEQVAYWIDGTTRLAIVLDDKPLMAQVQERIGYTLAHADSDGYLGPHFFKDPSGDFHRWPHALLFRGLAATAESTPADRLAIVEAMRKHYLEDKAAYGKPTRNVVNIETILWAYEETGDARLLKLAEDAWHDYLEVAADPEHGDLSTERVEANAPINAHGVTYEETAKQPAILYAYTGKQEYLHYALDAQRRTFRYMLIDGIPSTSEWYRGTTALDSHETCDISDHTWSWSHVLMATGDGTWGDHIERACFNAGPGAIKNDWKGVQYFSCPNQFLATLNSDHNAMAYGGRMMAYQPNPGQHTACCGGNVHRLMPNYVIRMWMRHRDGGLAATLYGPSRVTTTVNDHPVTITQKTDYPFDDRIALHFESAQPVEFPLHLRIPAWCDAPHVAVNGKVVRDLKVENGFVTLRRMFHSGDQVTLTLPMKTKVSQWPDHGVGVEHGPLVYSLPIGEAWSTVVEPRYTTETFPSWNANPTTPWNYGLALEHAKIEFRKGRMSDDPWSNPPTQIHVPARRIEGWELKASPKNPNQKFTPPLPDLAKASLGKRETLTLVPYGCTHLRVTIFPQIT